MTETRMFPAVAEENDQDYRVPVVVGGLTVLVFLVGNIKQVMLNEPLTLLSWYPAIAVATLLGSLVSAAIALRHRRLSPFGSLAVMSLAACLGSIALWATQG